MTSIGRFVTLKYNHFFAPVVMLKRLGKQNLVSNKVMSQATGLFVLHREQLYSVYVKRGFNTATPSKDNLPGSQFSPSHRGSARKTQRPGENSVDSEFGHLLLW